MSISPPILWIASCALGAAAVGWTGLDALSARRDAARALDDRERARAQASQIAQLRALVPAGSVEACAASELPARLAQAIASSGLLASAMASFSGEASARQGPGGPGRHRARMALGSVTLPQVGTFLESWRTLEPAWIVESIELTPAGEAPGGGDLPLRAAIAMECGVPDPGARQ